MKASGATRDPRLRKRSGTTRFWSGRKNAFPAAGRISPDYYCMDGTIPRKRPGRKCSMRIAADREEVRAALHERVPRRRRQPASADSLRREPVRTKSNGPSSSARKFSSCASSSAARSRASTASASKRSIRCACSSRPLELAAFHAVKAAFDPHALLNPGKAVPTLHRCAEYGRMHVRAGDEEVSGPAAILSDRQSALPQNGAFRHGTDFIQCTQIVDELASTIAKQRRTALRCAFAAAAPRIGTAVRCAARCSMSRAYRGIVAYEPTELVITARGGTPLAEIERRCSEGTRCCLRAAALVVRRRHATIGGVHRGRPFRPAPPPVPARRATSCSAPAAGWQGRRAALRRPGDEERRGLRRVAACWRGSLGTLGVILEVSLKVLPKPVAEATLAFEHSSADAIAALNEWARPAVADHRPARGTTARCMLRLVGRACGRRGRAQDMRR